LSGRVRMIICEFLSDHERIYVSDNIFRFIQPGEKGRKLDIIGLTLSAQRQRGQWEKYDRAIAARAFSWVGNGLNAIRYSLGGRTMDNAGGGRRDNPQGRAKIEDLRGHRSGPKCHPPADQVWAQG